MPHWVDTGKSLSRVDHLIKGSDMRQVAQQMEQLSEGELGALVKEVMGTHPEAGDVLKTLTKRRDALKPLLNEKWPGALGPVK